MVGEIEISQKQAKKLGAAPKTPLSPGLEKLCLRLCAKISYQQAEDDMSELLGLKVGHSTLHRLVQRTELPLAQTETTPITGVSIDGGKICLQGEEDKGGQWRDYKLVSCHDNMCEAFFQAPESLKEWSNPPPPKDVAKSTPRILSSVNSMPRKRQLWNLPGRMKPKPMSPNRLNSLRFETGTIFRSN